VASTNLHDRSHLAFVAEQSAWVRRLAVALAQDVHEGEDVSQEALLAATSHSMHQLGELRAWLATLVRNLMRERFRARARRADHEQLAAQSERCSDPSLALERLEMQEALLSAVRKLPEPYRTTVLLKWFEELSLQEIARRTASPLRTVHTRLHRALGMLREELDRRSRGDRSRWLAAWLPLFRRPYSLPWALVMHAKLKLVLAGISVLAVMSIWIALERPTPSNNDSATHPTRGVPMLDSAFASGNPATGSAAEAGRVAVSTGTAVSAPPANTSGAGLTVRSSIGLEFEFVEWQTPVGDWQRRKLQHARCDTTDMRFPLRLRAPGHVPTSVPEDGGEIVLDPDELLIIEGQDLHSCTTSIGIDWPYHSPGDPGVPVSDGIQSACMCGYLSATRWAMVVSHDLFDDARPGEQMVTAVLIWRDQQRTDIHLRSVAGARGRWMVPCEGRPEHSPLELRVQRQLGVPAGSVVIRVKSNRAQEASENTEQFDWGSATTYPEHTIWAADARLDDGTSDFAYDGFRIGESLVASARDEASGAYGRLIFDHDGSQRTIVLRPAFELIGRLASAADGSPVTNARLWWSFPQGDGEVRGWGCANGRSVISVDGAFRRLLPEAPLVRADMQLDPPSHIVLHVDAPGFESVGQTFETGGAARLDCGELHLTPVAPQIVLAPGHGLSSRSPEGESLRISGRPEVSWEMRGAALGADGSMSVYLVPTEESTKQERHFEAWEFLSSRRVNLPWPEEPSRWVMLGVWLELEGVGGDRLFELQPDGRYLAVPRTERDLVIECAAPTPDASDYPGWMIGWTWQGQWGQIERTSARRVGEVVRSRISAPQGASIYWSASGLPPGVLGSPQNVGGVMPFDALTERIVLR
jgi:RNA polymerase sigma-70 factor (ECF subfamily)